MPFEHLLNQLVPESSNPEDHLLGNPAHKASAKVYYLRQYVISPIADGNSKKMDGYLGDLKWEMEWLEKKLSCFDKWGAFVALVGTLDPNNFDDPTEKRVIESWKDFRRSFNTDQNALCNSASKWKWKDMVFGVRHINEVPGLPGLLDAGALDQVLGIRNAHPFGNTEKRLPPIKKGGYITYDLHHTYNGKRDEYRVVVGVADEKKHTPVYVTNGHYGKGTFMRMRSSSLLVPPDVH
jgi:hypothetical protein